MTEQEASNILDEWDVNFGDYTADEIAEAFDMAFKALERSRWIPTTDRLPEKDGKYLVTDMDGNVYISKFYTKRNMFDYATGIIAWMPLPEPYRAESEG